MWIQRDTLFEAITVRVYNEVISDDRQYQCGISVRHFRDCLSLYYQELMWRSVVFAFCIHTQKAFVRPSPEYAWNCKSREKQHRCLECSQDSSVHPFDKSTMEMKRLEWLEVVVYDRDREIFIFWIDVELAWKTRINYWLPQQKGLILKKNIFLLDRNQASPTHASDKSTVSCRVGYITVGPRRTVNLVSKFSGTRGPILLSHNSGSLATSVVR